MPGPGFTGFEPTGFDANGVALVPPTDTELVGYVAGVERVRIKNDGTGTGWPAVIGGSIPVIPEFYGAVGDGVTDDTAALTLWTASSKTLALTAGKTYLHRRTVSAAASGQTLFANGATLKRVAQASATTNTTITTGVTTQITLTGATNPFQLNDQILVSQGGATGSRSALRYISAINGQVITVSVAFNISFSGATNVYLGFNQVYVGDAFDNVRIQDLNLDGNVSNWTLTNWDVAVGIYVGANKNTVIDHCRLNNCPGDGMETNNSTNAVFEKCVVENIAARGFSFGGSGLDVGNKLIACRFYNCETNPSGYLSPPGGGSNDGHGNINFSLGGNDAVIEACQIDTGITGIGGGDNAAQSGVTISDNVIRNMSLAAIEGINSATPAIRYEIVGNRIYDSVRVNLNQGSAFSGAVEWHIADNLLVETDMLVNNYQNCTITNNRFYSTGTALTFLTLSNSGGAIGVSNSIVSDNRFHGGARAIVGATGDTGIEFSNNLAYNQLTSGIDTGAGSGNILVSDNIIIGPVSGTTYNGIVVNGAVNVRDNQVDMAGAGNNAIQVGAASVGARVEDNHCIGVNGGKNSIAILAGATRTEFRNNTMNTTYSDAGTNTIGKTGNRIAFGTTTAPMNGRAVLVGGTVTVSTGEVLTADNILLTAVVAAGTRGRLEVGTIVNKTSFVINSVDATGALVADTSTVYYEIRH